MDEAQRKAAQGKVHRNRHNGQHYLVSGWRGEQHHLSGRFGYLPIGRKSVVVAELLGGKEPLWADEEGNYYPGFAPSKTWVETINWPSTVTDPQDLL